MLINKINRFLIGSIFLCSSAIVSSCYDSKEKLHDYMAETGHTQEEYDNILTSTATDSPRQQIQLRQSALDSVAYRDLFNSTQAGNDSAMVAEFNKIAGKMKAANLDSYYDDDLIIDDFIDKISKEDKVSIKKADSIKNVMSQHTNSFDLSSSAWTQYCIDKYYYKQFFKKNNIMNSTFSDKFEKLSEKIKP